MTKELRLRDKIKQSFGRIFKISAHLLFREGYLLTKNFYGLTEHPKLTISRIMKKKDLSQGILIFGLPAGLWLGWILVLLVSRLFIFRRFQFGFLAKASFLASSLFVFICFCLLGYWTFRVWEKERGKGGS